MTSHSDPHEETSGGCSECCRVMQQHRLTFRFVLIHDGFKRHYDTRASHKRTVVNVKVEDILSYILWNILTFILLC